LKLLFSQSVDNLLKSSQLFACVYSCDSIYLDLSVNLILGVAMYKLDWFPSALALLSISTWVTTITRLTFSRPFQEWLRQ